MCIELQAGVVHCEISLTHLGISFGVLTIQVFFRQPYYFIHSPVFVCMYMGVNICVYVFMDVGTCEHVQRPEQCVDCSCLSAPPFYFNVGSLHEPGPPFSTSVMAANYPYKSSYFWSSRFWGYGFMQCCKHNM